MTTKDDIIAFQGRPGAYHELALKKLYPEAYTLPCETFDNVFDAVQEERATLLSSRWITRLLGVLPMYIVSCQIVIFTLSLKPLSLFITR